MHAHESFNPANGSDQAVTVAPISGFVSLQGSFIFEICCDSSVECMALSRLNRSPVRSSNWLAECRKAA